jgi:VacB/RNase II family 3'-5' exoribonuclease
MISKDLLIKVARQAMIDNGLNPDFGSEVLQQTASISQAAAENGAGIRDLRELPWLSIDNDSSRDLDQLSVAQALSGGAVRVLVAIADVDAIVKRGSAIDGYARGNTTSVYTAAGIFPMLPEKLSTDLTSLGEERDRLAIVIEMTVADDGSISESDIYRARVLNRAKLAYNPVGAWLEARGPKPARAAAVAGVDEQLRIQDRVAQSLRRVRHAHGALNLQTIQAQPVLDAGILSDLQPDQTNRAKELIEDLMVAANGVSARFLALKGFAALRRVLRTPKRWDRIVSLAQGLGETLPPAPSAPALNEFLAKRRAADPAQFPDLSLAVIKLLGSGEYAVELPGSDLEGHFGLAVKDYTHSTAPNRRFPDLLTQRLIKAALGNEAPPYTQEELQALAAHCTQQEDSASKVERTVGKSAAAMLLAPRVGAIFDGIVTGVSDKGTWVRISSPATEGKVVKGFEGLDVGDRVRVQLLHTDMVRGFIDFARAR